MVSINYNSNATGNLLKLCLGLKNIRWTHDEGIACGGESDALIRTKTHDIVGHAACILALEQLTPTPSLFPNGNVGMPIALGAWRAQAASLTDASAIKANACLIANQLHDGRSYLQGDAAGLADFQSASWLMDIDENLLNDDLLRWLNRTKTYLTSRGNELDCSTIVESEMLSILKADDGRRIITSALFQ